MAEENVTTKIVVNSDLSGLIGDLNKASASLMNFKDKLAVSNKQLATQVSVINRAFAETMRTTGQFSTHFVSLNSDVEKFGSQLDKGQLKLKQYFQTFNDHTKTSGGIIRQLAQQQVQLQNAILQPLGRNAEGLMQYNVHIPRGLDAIKNKSAIARQEIQILNKVVQEGANQLINWGKNTQWAGRQLTVGLTVPIAAFGKAAADAFRQADQELTRLTKVYGGIAATSSAELKKIRAEVTATAADLAKTYGASFQDTISLAADIAATGKQGNELLSSVRETTRLAVLGEVDRQDAMKATLAIQTAFKENTQQLGESINFLNAVENQTSTTLQDLVEAIPKAGPVIKGLGGNVKDLALYLTAMKEGGISATEGANALKSGLASLINPTKVAKETFTGFGINLDQIVTKNAGNTTAMILELQASLDKLDPLKKQKALEQLFGKFQFARMNALFSNLGKQGSQTLQVLDLMKASSQDLANIAGRELNQVTQSASGKYRRALEGLKADLAGVGDQFLNISTTLINIVDKVISFSNHLPKPLKQLLSVLGMFTAAAGPLIMLTGVMGNFIGYLVKGLFHLRSLFKGGEGWKLLTPEILAATKAGTLAEQAFYSDAKAATVFNQAVQGLTGSLAVLETRLNAGVLNIAPQMATMAAGIREVNPNHPLLSAMDTRSMSHMNPVAAMSAEQKRSQTLFGVLPGAPKVNQKLGAMPQIYMTGDLPKVPGVSSVRGVSTGVVASEAAKWHSMTAAIAMQSEAELTKLKTEVATTGLITEELSSAYHAILPSMNQLVTNAAAEAAQIVEEARVGKITAAEARAKITALNSQVEQMMVQTSTQTATNLGRSIDVTKVPLLNQPIVDAAGKSNLKEITKPGRTRDLLNKIAGVLGVKTYGAGYSIETTRPKRLNSGGGVFLNNGNQVPGPNINADVVPAMLTPGEFVIRRGIAQQDPEGMRALNAGQAMIVPVQNRANGGWMLNALEAIRAYSGMRVGGARRIYSIPSPRTGLIPNPSSRSIQEWENGTGPTRYSLLERRSSLYNRMNPWARRAENEVHAHVITSGLLRRFGTRGESYPTVTGSRLSSAIGRNISSKYSNTGLQVLPEGLVTVTEGFNQGLRHGTATGTQWLSSGRKPQHLLSVMSTLLNAGVPPKLAYRVAGKVLSRIDNAMTRLGDMPLTETKWGNIVNDATIREFKLLETSLSKGALHLNSGGHVPGYAAGGGVSSKFAVLKRLGALFSVNEGGRGYTLNALPMKPNVQMFKDLPLSYRGKKYLYDALAHSILGRSGKTTGQSATGMLTPYGRMSKTVKGFGHADQYDIWQDVARQLKNNPNLSPKDREFFNHIGIVGQTMPQSVGMKVLGLNRGGKVPGYVRGGKVARFAGMMAAPVLGQQIGSMLGGAPGGMIGGLLGSFVGMGPMRAERQNIPVGARLGTAVDSLPKFKQSIFAGKKFGETLAVAAETGGKFSSTLSRMALGVSRLNAGLAIGTTIAVMAYTQWDKANKARKASQDAIKIDQKGASQLGITYKSVINNVKETTSAILEQKKLLEARAAGAAGVGGGVSLTVDQLKALQKELKQTSPDIIKMFDNMNRNDVVKNVADLKAQLVASGVSAEKATNKIYALMSLSNKAGMTASALGSGDFSGIYDQKSAAQYTTKTMGKALLNKTDSKELINTFDQGLGSIESYYTSLSKVKDSTGKLVFDNKAVAKTIKDISSSENGRVKLGKENLAIILKQKPELNNILSASDSLADAWVKTKLYTSGVAADLSKLSGPEAQGLLQVVEVLKSRATALTTTDTKGPFAGLIKAAASATKFAKAATAASEAASTKAQQTADSQTKAIDKVIQKLNNEYDARRKLIDLQATTESFKISQQKEQLNYQQALAAGDTQAAAQSQLNLRQMSLEFQKTQALAALEDKHNADVKKQDDAKQKVQDNLNAAQAKAAKLAAAAAAAQQKASSIAIIQQQIASTLLAASMTTDAKELDKLGKSFQSSVGSLAKLAPDAAKALTPENTTATWGLVNGKKVPVAGGQDWTGKLMSLTQGQGTAMFDKNTQDSLKNFGLTLANFNLFWAKLLKLPGVEDQSKKAIKDFKPVTSLGSGVTPSSTAAGGTYQLKAAGGLLRGPGTGTSDSIFMPMLSRGRYAGGAYVSTGEYVVNAASVRKPGTLSLLDKINYNVPSNMWGVGSHAMSMGMGNITIAPVIHAAPGMDEHMVADIASRKAFDMLRQHQNTTARSIGGSKVVGR